MVNIRDTLKVTDRDMSKPLVFIVEDQKPLAMAYGDALDMVGYQTRLLFDGKQALDALNNTIPDMIVLDMNLPGVSGHYVFRHLRSQKQLLHIPVIVATANSLLASAIEKELGSGDHLLIKPVSLMELQKLGKRLYPPV